MTRVWIMWMVVRTKKRARCEGGYEGSCEKGDRVWERGEGIKVDFQVSNLGVWEHNIF